MKSHFSEETDEAVNHADTAADACVRRHRQSLPNVVSQLLGAGVAVAVLLGLANYLEPTGQETAGVMRSGAHAPVAHWKRFDGSPVPSHEQAGDEGG